MSKLDKAGNFKWFPGSTIISFLDPKSPWHKLCRRVQERVKASEFGSCFSFLPPESFHCTILNLVTEANTSKRPSGVDVRFYRLVGVSFTELAP